jgi:hypothetical protein
MLLFGLFLSVMSFAQNNVGLFTGLNFAGISQNGISTGEFSGLNNYTFGSAGIIYGRNLDKHWILMTGVNFARRGAESLFEKGITVFDNTYDVGAKLVHKMDYLEIPVLFLYKFNSAKNSFTPYVFAGPQFSYESSYKIDVKAHLLIDFNILRYDVDLSNNIFNRYDLSAVAGAGMSFPVKNGVVNLDARYIYGISDILDNPLLDLNLKHRNIRIGISYMYEL